MSSQGASKKRCIVKKLDFENCIVTNIKTKSSNRRKFRARITHEIKNVDSEEEEPPISPVLTQNISKTKRNKSRVYPYKRKLNFRECEESPRSSTERSSQTSPVFKVKTSKISSQLPRNSRRIESYEISSQLSQTKRRIENDEIFSQGSSNYQIEDFSEDSKHSVEISSVDSEDVQMETSKNHTKTESHVCGTSWNANDLSDTKDDWLELLDKINETSAPVKKRYKKNSLRGRLQKLLRRQASDKLIWEHKIRNKVSPKSQKLSVVSFWSEESKFFFLKCQTLEAEPEGSFLVVDSRWAPNVRKAKVGSLIRLHPPWQKMLMKLPRMTVYVNVVCLEILDDVIKPGSKEVSFESIPYEPFDFEPLVFLDTLLASNISSYLY